MLYDGAVTILWCSLFVMLYVWFCFLYSSAVARYFILVIYLFLEVTSLERITSMFY